MKSIIKVQLLRENAKLPSKSTEGSAGFDLYAAEMMIVPALSKDNQGQLIVGSDIVPIGIAIQLPSGTVGKLASRSGLSMQFNIEVGAGWIDCDYRGEIVVKLFNFGGQDYQIEIGDRIAQLVVLSLPTSEITLANHLDTTKRGYCGLGSSGR